MVEYQMVQNLETQERLRAALATAQVREAVHLAQAQHDAGIEEARTLAESPYRPWRRCMTSLRT